MTIGGWISMTIALGFAIGLFGWCCYKMATAPPSPYANESELSFDKDRDVRE